MSSKTLIIIPTYQESENIISILERVQAANPEANVLVVDDSSPDGTGQIVERLMKSNPKIRLLTNSVKGGLGKAYVKGFKWGLSKDFDIFVEMDADGSHAPEQLPSILKNLDECDVSLGSRWVPGGRIENWPISRQILSKGGNLYTRLMLGFNVKDATGGYRAYKRKVLETIDLDSIESQGYCFQVDMVRRSLAFGFKVCETPIVFTEREAGNSKMSRQIVIEAFTRIGFWGLKRLFRIK
ncbi:MAG: polyprenol monophosphomannose synthase, partial [Candidatus Nanopelagicales bacterium]